MDVMNWKKSHFYITRVSMCSLRKAQTLTHPPTHSLTESYANMTALQLIPRVKKLNVVVSQSSSQFKIKVSNPSSSGAVAFLISIRACHKKSKHGEDHVDIPAVMFSDNYFHLAPGDARTVGVWGIGADAMSNGVEWIVNSWSDFMR